LYDLASLNVAHYRNSADYEESSFIVGQPTPVLTGLTEDWVEKVLKGTLTLGSRANIPLPVGAEASLLQCDPNSMPKEAMDQKEQQMAELGARLLREGASASTATAKIIDTSSESCTLAQIAENTSLAIEYSLEYAGEFLNVDATDAEYRLNKDFDLTSMTADDQNAIIKQWQAAGIAFSEMRTALRRAGIVTLSDEDAKKQIDEDIKAGRIPDPKMENKPPASPAANDPKARSDAGGPQPQPIRRQSNP